MPVAQPLQEAGATGLLDAQPALRIQHLSKTFPGQRALSEVHIEIGRGEICALVGQNGSGKSTLIKILAGFHRPDAGCEVWMGGEPIDLIAHHDGLRRGVRFIHQDLSLVPSLSIRENLALDNLGRPRLAPLRPREERSRARRLLLAFGLTIDPDTLVNDLTRFEQSAVEIVRALAAIDDEDVHLLVLDEPTASMGAAEAQQLFATLRRVKDMGIAVLYVSHTLPEVLEIADRVTVLRDGQIVADRDVAGISEKELIEIIVGHSIEHASPPVPGIKGLAPVLAVHELTLDGLEKASFAVHKNEILGITGLIGSGYEQVGRCLSGIVNWEHGTVVIDGERFQRLTPGIAMRAGLIAMPADRIKAGLIPQFSIAENVTLPDMSSFWKRGHLNYKAEISDVLHWIRVTGVVPPDPGRLVQELSGGNQQKVLLAKALRLRPRVLCLSEPTQAVDVGAAATIRRLITDLASDDRAIVVCSSDAEELVQVCQRVLITRGGRIATELSGDEITEDRIVAESQFKGSTR